MKVYGSDDPEVSRGKPHPDIFRVAASRFDLHHHLLLNILAQVWSATSLARELPGHRGQHGWCGGWAPCRDAGDQLIISRYKLRVVQICQGGDGGRRGPLPSRSNGSVAHLGRVPPWRMGIASLEEHPKRRKYPVMQISPIIYIHSIFQST